MESKGKTLIILDIQLEPGLSEPLLPEFHSLLQVLVKNFILEVVG